MPRTLASYSVEVAWSKAQAGVAVVDTATVDGASTVGGAFGNYTYTTVTTEVKDVLVERGYSADTRSMQDGRCTVRFKDTTGKYNPENPSSPLAGSLLPMRPLRLRATHNAVTYGLFFGWVTRIEHDPHPSAQETTIEAVDFLDWLGRLKPVIPTMGSGRVAGEVIRAVLDRCGWTDPSFVALDAGHTLSDFTADGTKTAGDLIADILTVDQGAVYVRGDGVVVFYANDRFDQPGASAATWTQTTIGDAAPAVDVQQLVNGQTVVRRSAGASRTFTAVDATSRDPITGYGPRDGDTVDSPLFFDDGQAENLANYLVYRRKDPYAPTRRVVIHNDDDTLIVQQLVRDLGDRVTLTENQGGTSTTGTLSGVRHRIWEGGRFHEAAFTLIKRRFDAALVGTSTVDGAHVVGY